MNREETWQSLINLEKRQKGSGKRGLPLKIDKPTAVPSNAPHGKTVEDRV